MHKASIKELNHLLGNIDLYLLDQILKARFEPHFRILDAGCGEGRNLLYFIQNGYQVWGIDKNADSIQMLKYIVKSVNRDYPQDRFVQGNIENMPYHSNEFDTIVSSAVWHFAEDKSHFLSMFQESVRVLKPGGILFARMATDRGIEDEIQPMNDEKHVLPDGSVRFLLTKSLLNEIITTYGLEFIEPFKSVVVDNQRSMSTLVLRKM